MNNDSHNNEALGPRVFHLAMLLRKVEMHDGSHPEAPRPGAPFQGRIFEGQGRVLTLLAMHSPIAQRELAYILGVRPQSLGEVLAKLESAELVERTVNPDDARARLVTLTDTGKAKAQELADRPTPNPLEALTPEERDQFLDMLQRVTAHLEQTVGWQEGDGHGFGAWPGPGFGPGGGRGGFGLGGRGGRGRVRRHWGPCW